VTRCSFRDTAKLPAQSVSLFARKNQGDGGANLSEDMTRYFVWAAIVVAGAVLAVVDWRWIKRPVCGALLVGAVGGGIIVTNVSPFTFGTGGHYMEGVLISAGSALALVGYVLAAVGQFAWRRISGHGPS
jgi:hypothetical protein